MVAEDNIVRVGNGENTRRVGFLADVGMRGADQLAGAELGQETLFEATNEQHGFEESIVIIIHDGHIITQGQCKFQVCYIGYAHILP